MLCELLPVVRRNFAWTITGRFLFLRASSFITSRSAVWPRVQMESMLRYEFCVHALIVLAILHFLHQLPTPPTVGARIWHGGHRAAQCGRAQRARVVRLEFYEGQLGGLNKHEN